MKEVKLYLNNLLKVGDVVVVATSGGPDSMCLLDLLCEFKKKVNIEIIVAHVNHKLRVESEEEKDFVLDYALKNNLKWEYMEIKEYDAGNLESLARQKRYEFFEEVILKYHANYLMTAHHGDDLMETILMRLVRGSSLKGYKGFNLETNAKNYKIIRPLIMVSKNEIINYMEEKNLKYFIDKSNYSMEYTRNRYRKVVLPFLKEENPNVHLKFWKFNQELNEVDTFLDNYIKKIIANIKSDKGIDIKELIKLDKFLIKKIVEYELSLIYINDLFLVSDNNTKEILKLIYNKKTNGRINLPNGYEAIKEYNYFKIEHNKNVEEFEEILDKEVRFNGGVIKKLAKTDLKNNYVIKLNSKDLKMPIIVRTRRPGDVMEVKNLNGHKKVKDILIDEKVAINKRKTLPVVEDSLGQIIWLPGVKKSKFDVDNNKIYDIILLYEEE